MQKRIPDDAIAELEALRLGQEMGAIRIPLCTDEVLFESLASGDWLYRGSALPPKFAKLFAGILHCIAGEHFLITPVEKVRLKVAEAPLLIVDFEQETSDVKLITSIGSEHHIADVQQMVLTEQGIYLPLERELWGKLSRACYYRFVSQFNLAEGD